MTRQPFTTVSIPIGLLEQVDMIIKENPGLGYVTSTEFIKDAIRRRLESLNDDRRVFKKE